MIYKIKIIYLSVFIIVVILMHTNYAFSQKIGSLNYNNITKRYEFYNGSVWKALLASPTLLSCTKEGTMDYDKILRVYKYCNGSKWMSIIGTPTLTFCNSSATIEFTGSQYRYCNGLIWVAMH